MLWDIIRDFFVQYIWGGVSSTGGYYYNNFFGNGVLLNDNLEYVDGTIYQSPFIPLNLYDDGAEVATNYFSLYDWLSTTSTIIVLIGICIFLYLVTKYLFKFVAGLFKW